jgi:putative ABC transport system substrate-binding protein
MQRREFITLIGGAAAWPLAASGQQRATPVVGFLSSRSRIDSADAVASFHAGLNETGFSEGRNATFEYRWADGSYDRLPALAAELAQRPISLIVAVGGIVSTRAAKAATSTIPIIFVSGGDPVENGLVASLSRPGANLTGVSLLTSILGAKRLELLIQVVPAATVIALLIDPNTPDAERETNDVLAGARVLGRDIRIFKVTAEHEFEPAFVDMAAQRAGALMVGADPFLNSRREQLVALAAQYRLPAIYHFREFALAGGLISYGSSVTSGYRLAGVYAGRVLKGEKPADLPVVQPTTFEMVINLRTAKALALDIPGTMLVRADEVIE